jgi:plastocyanin
MRASLASGLSALLCIASIGHLNAQSASIEGVVAAPGEPSVGAVVFLVPKEQTGESYAQRSVTIDQVQLRFVPPLLVVTPGTVVSFQNSDPILHNIFSPQGTGPGFDLGMYPRGEFRSHTFDEVGTHVILCNVHPEMVAYLLVVPTTLFTVVGEGGRFSLEDVPAGNYALKVWHRSAGSLEREILLGDGDFLRLRLQLPTADS